MIRQEAGMSTSRFCELFDMPERTWRRWQSRHRDGESVRGPWPTPARDAAHDMVIDMAQKHPAWGHRKIWAMTRYEGGQASASTVMRIMQDANLLLPTNYQKHQRDLAGARRAAFAQTPTGANQVWQLDFSEFETISGGVWRLAGCRDYWSKYEYPWHISPTANQHDAIEAVELALAEYEALAGAPLIDSCNISPDGEIEPCLTIVTDNGGPFRSFRFEHFIASHPELRHVRTRVKSPGQNGSRERGFGSLKYERLYQEEIHDALELTRHAEEYRLEYNTVRPHEAIAWNRPLDVHLGHASPDTPNFAGPIILPTT
ncbi:integrase core domain-containing protein [Brachybacterium sp. UMB0905]|uniref:integrase core domain-containing protein n=1 Tax=Brachybacterium sp. UMB0905 TaxID=2069310 RepID=UPI000C80B9DB|nr:integrase core domain-containing protein [Brachybacterium sp. UMB0905]PMC74209.1 transposase [Brachybacterium sp. UMB0905]